MANLTDLVTKLRANPLPPGSLEERAKLNVISPLLAELGWDFSDPEEVVPEYGIGAMRVDFCLRIAGTAKVFIEAKKPSEDRGTHQEQLLQYAFREGIDLAALTNGPLWWLYLPKANGSWEQRKFFVIDIRQQEPSAVADHFAMFLSRSAIAGGEAVLAAHKVLDTTARSKAVNEALPLVWARLLGEPDDLLVDLIAEAVESQCGHRPDTETVATFLAHQIPATPGPVPRLFEVTIPRGVTSDGFVPANIGYTGKTPTSFTLFGETQAASSWKQVLIGVAAEIYRRHASDFDQATTLVGRKRSYFATDKGPLLSPEPIPGSHYFAETNLSANAIMKRCTQLLTLFHHQESDLTVETR